LNQLNITGDICDVWNHRIVEWKYGGKNSRVLAVGNGEGNRTDQLHFPTAVIIDKVTDNLIICDAFNERVMRWPKGAIQGDIIADGNGEGDEAKQLRGPVVLSFDRYNNLSIVDSNNNIFNVIRNLKMKIDIFYELMITHRIYDDGRDRKDQMQEISIVWLKIISTSMNNIEYLILFILYKIC